MQKNFPRVPPTAPPGSPPLQYWWCVFCDSSTWYEQGYPHCDLCNTRMPAGTLLYDSADAAEVAAMFAADQAKAAAAAAATTAGGAKQQQEEEEEESKKKKEDEEEEEPQLGGTSSSSASSSSSSSSSGMTVEADAGATAASAAAEAQASAPWACGACTFENTAVRASLVTILGLFSASPLRVGIAPNTVIRLAHFLL